VRGASVPRSVFLRTLAIHAPTRPLEMAVSIAERVHVVGIWITPCPCPNPYDSQVIAIGLYFDRPVNN
jgi:hypothetical protein